MKKLLAILLSALLLCAMVPFGTVAAAEGDPTVQLSIVDELESVDAGEEFQVEVNFLNLEDTAGLISALIEIGFDSDAFELVTTFDEDEEMWIPPIEIGSKYNASSNKYIMFSPIDEETGAMERCLVKYMRATASASQVRREEHFFTVTFKVKDDAASGTYDLTAIQYDGLWHGTIEFKFATENTSIKVNGTEPPAGCEHVYDNACDANCNLCGEVREVAGHNYVDGVCSVCGAADPNYVPPCQHEYDNACDADCNLCGEIREVAGHSYEGVETQAPTCEVAGVMTYTCANCGDSYTEAIATTCANNAVYHEGVEAGCHYKGQTDYWYCANCDVFYADAACTIVTNYLNTIIPALQDTAEYVPAKTPSCTENGNTEYWYCEQCEQIWADEALTQLTNIKNVQIAPSCKYGAVYTAAKDANCFEEGNVEYWYCANCDVVYADADCTIITNFKNVILPVSHNVIHVEYKAPTCTAMGNIEYWYCETCGSAWLDELCHFNTNLMAIRLPVAAHTYTNAHDASCDVCGAVRDVVLNAEEIILFGGNSVTTESIDGLAFKFDVAVDGITFGEAYVADYSNATVTVEGVEYKLVKMGVVANNQGYANQTLENVDDTYVLNVEAVKAFEDVDGTHFAVRFINIPEEHLDTVITARSYFIYENAGEQIVVYGEDIATTYNAELG